MFLSQHLKFSSLEIWRFFYLLCYNIFYLSFSFANLWHTVIITVLMSLSTNAYSCILTGWFLPIFPLILYQFSHFFLYLVTFYQAQTLWYFYL
jgi:hypothetical protein